jgi:outer membrane protein assembly factor BamD
MVRNAIHKFAIPALVAVLFLSSGCRKKAYENPITKDTQQPDKVLFDTAIDDIEHGRYERARLTLQTLMNTYDTSEYLAKAKLAVADSWYREGGARGMAQAEAEYKDFILFYQAMEEAAEAQEKICKMQYQQMDKADRDPTHALRAQDECRTLLTNFPNSKFVPEAQQMMRNVQEVLADAEYRVGYQYSHKGSYPAAASRLQALTDQFPLYSRVDDALWLQADAYQKMGDNFENQQADAYTKLVKQYPLSPHVDEAKSRLKAMNRPIPQVDEVAYAHMKYEQENRTKRSLIGKIWGPFAGHPDFTPAAKSGAPSMEGLHPSIPASVPPTALGTQGTVLNPVASPTGGAGSDVTATTVKDTNLIDTAPNVLPGAPGTPAAATPAGGTASGGTAPAAAPAGSVSPSASTVSVGGVQTTVQQQANAQKTLPQNHTGKIKKLTPAQQLKETQRQQEAFKKMAKKQADQQKKAQDDQAKADKKAADKKKKTDQSQQPPSGSTTPPAQTTAKQ